jgi:hypothetical protein
MNPLLNENIILHILSFVVPPVYTIKSKYDPSEYFDEEKRKWYNYDKPEYQQSYKFSKYAKGYELDTLFKERHYINLQGLCENTEDEAVDCIILLRKTDYCQDIKFNTVKFPSNPNPKAVEYTLKNRSKFMYRHYIPNTNDIVVNELISRMLNSILIDVYDNSSFNRNTNPIMVNWIIENKHINKLFLSNSSDIAVQYILSNTSFIINHLKITFQDFIALLCENKNDMAIEYVLKHPQHIDWYLLSKNKNQVAVEYILRPENIHKNDLDTLSKNGNEKVVRFLLQKENRHLIDHYSFSSNAELLNYTCVLKESHYETIRRYYQSIA